MNAKVIRDKLLLIAAARSKGATFCPSEVARTLANDWRPLMPQIREVASALVNEDKLVCTQQGVKVEPLAAHGPIRLARKE